MVGCDKRVHFRSQTAIREVGQLRPGDWPDYTNDVPHEETVGYEITERCLGGHEYTYREDA